MLERAYKLREPILLFVATADQRFGPITTIRGNSHIKKHIPWTAFTFSDDDWKRVREAADLLAVRYAVPLSQDYVLTLVQDSNRIQQASSAEKRPTLWRALPLIEELQTAWERKRDNPRFARYRSAINDGLAKLNKYYSRFDEKPAYIIALGNVLLSLHCSTT